MKQVKQYTKRKLLELGLLTIPPAIIFLYYELVPLSTTTLFILIVLSIVSLDNFSDIFGKGMEESDKYKIPEELKNETDIETSTYKNKIDAYMGYLDTYDTIYISEEAVKDYNNGEEEKVIAALKHEEGHAKRKYIDYMIENGIMIMTLLTLGLLSKLTDSIILGAGVGSLIIVSAAICLAISVKWKEKKADIYSIEEGHLRGIIELYKGSGILTKINTSTSYAYPTVEERQIWIGKYLKKNKKSYITL
jgi:hypothetical protein